MASETPRRALYHFSPFDPPVSFVLHLAGVGAVVRACCCDSWSLHVPGLPFGLFLSSVRSLVWVFFLLLVSAFLAWVLARVLFFSCALFCSCLCRCRVEKHI